MERYAVQITINEKVSGYMRTATLPTFYVYANGRTDAVYKARLIVDAARYEVEGGAAHISVEPV